MPLPLLLGLLFLIVMGIGWILTRSGAGSGALVTERLESYEQGEMTATLPSVSREMRPAAPVKRSADVFTQMDKAFEKRDFYGRMVLEFQKADLKIRYSEYVAFSVGLIATTAGLTYVASNSLAIALTVGFVTSVIPRFYVRVRQMRRIRNIDQQLVDALILISNSLKSGYSFLQGVELVAEEAPEPISVEFRRMMREINLGQPVDSALDHMVERVPSEDLDLVITSVKIQRQVGGNLAEVLDKIVHTIRERIRIKGEIATLTAMGKLQGIILTLLPFVMGVIISFMAPEFMSLLWTTLPGKLMMGWAFIQMAIGGFLIFKIVDIKV